MRFLVIPMLVAATLFPVAVFAAPSKAVCLVCQMKEGAREEEAVKASRTHDGVEYYFCSEKCAKAFDADPAAYAPRDLPFPAPAFALVDLAGRKVTPDSLRGRVTLIDFWATWCAPCVKTMPELQALHTKYAARGFGVLGVSIDEGGAGKVKKFVGSKKITYPIAIDDGANPAWEAYRVKAVPAAFLVDREGRVVAQWTGASPARAELEKMIEELLRAD